MARQAFNAVTRALGIAHSRNMEDPHFDHDAFLYQICQEMFGGEFGIEVWQRAGKYLSSANGDFCQAQLLAYSGEAYAPVMEWPEKVN